ncbi:MAG: NCS2 family permease [Proteobacteria bacterium]|nr:NCS2 family permease [Pseudomonadota bacterium]
MAMAYITVVNPAILSEAGMDFGAVFVATCLAAALGSILMGWLANYPVSLAPGMGQNAFFVYGIVLVSGHDWRTALGAVFLSGVIFVGLSVLPVREWLINAIPRGLKLGISAGVGLFIGFIALRNAGVVVPHEATLVALADVSAPGPLLALLGFAAIVALSARGVRGAVLLGMLGATAAGWALGAANFEGVLAVPPDPSPVFLQLDIAGAFQWSMLTTILALLLVDLFDTAGTLVGVATRAGLTDAEGRLPRLRRALLADSGATVAGALLGTSSTTSYVESGAGVEAGGRTGLAAVVTGLLFLVCLFLAPLAQSVPPFATAAALLFVACLMVRGLADLDWGDYTESVPAAVTALAMPLVFSISDGIGIGFIACALIKLASGKARECPSAVYAVAAIFALKFALLG